MSSPTFTYQYDALSDWNTHEQKAEENDWDWIKYLENDDFSVEGALSGPEKGDLSIVSVPDVALVDDANHSEIERDAANELLDFLCQEYDEKRSLEVIVKEQFQSDANLDPLDADVLMEYDDLIDHDIAELFGVSNIQDDSMEGVEFKDRDVIEMDSIRSASTLAPNHFEYLPLLPDGSITATTDPSTNRVTPPVRDNGTPQQGQAWAFRNIYGLDSVDFDVASKKSLWLESAESRNNCECPNPPKEYNDLVTHSIHTSPCTSRCVEFVDAVFGVTNGQGWPLTRVDLTYFTTLFAGQFQEFSEQGKPNQVTIGFVKVQVATGKVELVDFLRSSFYDKKQHIYTYSQPCGLDQNGNVGIMVAIAQGFGTRVQLDELPPPDYLDSATFNYELEDRQVPDSRTFQNDVTILRSAYQCLPLLCYGMAPLYNGDEFAMEKLNKIKKGLSALVDSFFNNDSEVAHREPIMEHMVNPIGLF